MDRMNYSKTVPIEDWMVDLRVGQVVEVEMSCCNNSVINCIVTDVNRELRSRSANLEFETLLDITLQHTPAAFIKSDDTF